MWVPKIEAYLCGCQNYEPFLGTLNIRCRIMIGIQQGTIILTTTHIETSEDLTSFYEPYMSLTLHWGSHLVTARQKTLNPK